MKLFPSLPMGVQAHLQEGELFGNNLPEGGAHVDVKVAHVLGQHLHLRGINPCHFTHRTLRAALR